MLNFAANPNSDDEPIVKKARICCRPTSSLESIYLQYRDSDTNSTKTNLCDLPNEILDKIIGNINIWHHNRIRGTCQRFRVISDLHILHKFNEALAKHTKLNPRNYESAALMTIKYATNVYVRYGFQTTLCGCMLAMLRRSYKDSFCPEIHEIVQFLRHFYNMIEYIKGDPRSQQASLLFGLTLISLLKSFDKCSIVSQNSSSFYWRVMMELKGPWLGKLWTPKGRAQCEPYVWSHLLVILAELQIANINDKAYKRVWHCPSDIHIFGNDTSNGKRIPCTLFTINVHGSSNIRALFQNCLDKTLDDELAWPVRWPSDEFTFTLDISCKEAAKLGCCKSQHLNFSAFPNIDDEEDDKQEEEMDEGDEEEDESSSSIN